MPHPLELPGMLRAVVPHVGGERLAVRAGGLVSKLVALAFRHPLGRGLNFSAGNFPRFSAVIGALNDLPEPSTGLRSIDAIRVYSRTFQVVQLPSRKMRSAHIPFF